MKVVDPNQIYVFGAIPGGDQIADFSASVYSWVERNALTAIDLDRNIAKTKADFIRDWNAAGIPSNYTYDLYSLYRAPAEQIQAFRDGWKAARESRHVLGQAGDIHIYKDGRRIRGDELAAFYDKYIKGKFMDFTLLYDWGFHTHWTGKITAIAKNPLIWIAAGLALYWLFNKD